MKCKVKVAIEGPVCAGKTTLCNNLLNGYGESKMCIIPDYSDFAGGGKNLPNALPAILEQQIEALNFFVKLEAARFQHYLRDTTLCVIDRSVHTLIAHCNAIAPYYDVNLLSIGKTLLYNTREIVRPDFILYLDVPHQTLIKRNHGKFTKDSIFIKEDFNRRFREYFTREAQSDMSTPLEIIDGMLRPDIVCAHAAQKIEAIIRAT